MAHTPRDGASERHEEIAEDRRHAGCFLTPGPTDSHQHLPPVSPLKLSGLYCLLYPVHGVTTVLDAGDGEPHVSHLT
jgi:predicted amidohydrolase